MEKPKPVSGPPSSSETAAAHPSPNEIAGAVASALREKALAKLERARPYQAPTKPSMKRRCDYNDYTAPKIYMVTLVVEGRRPLFGTLSGDPHIPYATQGGARLIVSQAEHHNERTAISRNKCLEINEMARLLCQESPPAFPRGPLLPSKSCALIWPKAPFRHSKAARSQSFFTLLPFYFFTFPPSPPTTYHPTT